MTNSIRNSARRPKASYLIPTVIEKPTTANGRTTFTPRLLKDRIIMLGSPIDDGVANTIVAQILFLESQDKGKDIALRELSGRLGHGRSCHLRRHAARELRRFDHLHGHERPWARSSSRAEPKAAFRAPERRLSMIHQPLGGMEGKATDIKIHAERILKMREQLNKIPPNTRDRPLRRWNKTRP